MFILLITVLGLMLWSVQLMVSAFRQSDFSLLFAGTLVAISSAGIVTAYSLMNGTMGYLDVPDMISAGPTSGEVSQYQSTLDLDTSSRWFEDIPLLDEISP